jgi:hypothetical protein
MLRHNLDGKVLDYTWKQNRLSKDKEALKNSVLNVIRKKPADAKKPEEAKQVSGGATPVINAAFNQGSPDQGFSAVKRTEAGDYQQFGQAPAVATNG